MYIFEPVGGHGTLRGISPDTDGKLVAAAFQMTQLAERWRQARAIGAPLSIVYLRVRQLKDIELAFGHAIAAEVLRQVARRIAPWVAHEGGLARVAEDILGLVLYGRDAADAKLFAEALCHMLDAAIDIDDMSVVVTIQAGVASNSGETASPETMVREANAALFHGTLSGASVSVFAIGAHRTYVDRLTLMGDLRGAIDRDELRLYCQPKIDMKTGRISGAEALVRWAHPRLGLITPVHFIKLAEQNGIISRVTNWMLNATMGYLRGWQESGYTGKLALNLSAHDVRNPAMAQRIEDQLDAWGVRPELIQFELTESALIEDPDAALAALSRIKACGADVFIDDYGTGYASLSYLQRFPVDGIKIDQSFISPMLHDPDSAVIVRSTIELGHALGSQVIAEGVENAHVWKQLTEHGCDQAQGYLISMPMPIEELAHWQSRWERVADASAAVANAHSRCFDPPHLA